MQQKEYIAQLHQHKDVFKALLTDLPENLYTWKILPDKWNLLEILCHLHDEEREDFRARIKHILEHSENPMPSIDPQAWVQDRNYSLQNYSQVLNAFLQEREYSIEWLLSLNEPKWDQFYVHPKLGKMTASMMLCNWLAHDYLHIRQINKVKYEYLLQMSKEDLSYAGNW
ncbi:MAG: DinB family protein [Saprospiraceae bacterium]|nr:DinB family protein [Saprospiraceae bacterium]